MTKKKLLRGGDANIRSSVILKKPNNVRDPLGESEKSLKKKSPLNSVSNFKPPEAGGKRKHNGKCQPNAFEKRPSVDSNGMKIKRNKMPASIFDLPMVNEVSRHGRESDESSTETAGEELNRSAQRANRSVLKERLRRTLFVGNLPVGVSRKSLKRLINETLKADPQCAESGCSVESVRFRGVVPSTGGTGKLSRKRAAIHGDFSAGVSKTLIAYVVLSSPVGIRATLKLNGHWLASEPTHADSQTAYIETPVTNSHGSGTHIRVDRASAQHKQQGIGHHSKCVFLGNLPFDSSEEEIRNALVEFGEINSVRLIRDRDTGAVKGIGFVEFTDMASVSLAIRASGTAMVRNRTIRVEEYDTKPKLDAKNKSRTKSAKSEALSKDTDVDPKTMPKKKIVGRKLNHKGHLKGITLPSNLRGPQREAYLQKRLLKKRKRQQHRQNQMQKNPDPKPRARSKR